MVSVWSALFALRKGVQEGETVRDGENVKEKRKSLRVLTKEKDKEDVGL